MNDLSKLPDRELDALFATEVAGWTDIKGRHVGKGGTNFQGTLSGYPPRKGYVAPVSHFSTSLDALMPWVEEVRKAGTRLEIWSIDNGWIFEIHDPHDWGTTQEVEAATLPRAVAEALILWKRAQKGEK